MKKNYQFLNNINFPSDLRKVSENNLQKVKIFISHFGILILMMNSNFGQKKYLCSCLLIY